jgi:hypothetical protein
MASVMIKCPNTGQGIPTGIETESISFNQLPNVTASTQCAVCGEMHAWTKRDAWLVRFPAPYQQPGVDHHP